jgi:multisubunit Na+/H+ antiporter MnhG subunit
MFLFRLFLIVCLIVLTGYTAVTIGNHGWNLFPTFFADMAAMGWAGQFNLDFMMMLMLSAIWTAWRHQFSPAGLLLAVLAFNGGMLFLSIYVTWHLSRNGGDMKALLLGDARARLG